MLEEIFDPTLDPDSLDWQEEEPEEALNGDDASEGLYEQYRFVADAGQTLLRIDKFLVCRITKVSRNRIQEAADAGCILVNEKPVKSNYRVKPNDVIAVMVTRPPVDTELIPEDIPLDIVYEDADVMVVNKPAGMVVHPGHGNYSGTLVNGLAWHFKANPTFPTDDPRPGLVHRIDKDTSGLLVVAKNPAAKAHLGWQFFHKTTHRLYTALVWGSPVNDEGRVEGNIGRSPKDRQQMMVFPDGSQGKPAVTHYRVLERFGYVTLIECALETGRTHQIRVHMKSIGHPLFNDARYGGNEILKGTTYAKYKQFVKNCFDICNRQALHARTLGFRHPVTGEDLCFEAPLPEDMQALIDKWRGYIASRDMD
jgi:23S rRNA pseudouridine1911/1915/1917 synthase